MASSRRISLQVCGISPPARRWGCREAGAGDGEERRGEHGQDRVAVPGGPAADLVLIEPGLGLGDREGFLDAPPASGDADQLGQRGAPPVVAQEVGVLGVTVGLGVGGAADQQAARPTVGAAGRVQGDPGPGVGAQPLRARALAALLPAPAGNLTDECVGPGGVAGMAGDPKVAADLEHVAVAGLLDRAAQGRAAAVDLVCGDIAERHPGGHRAVEHAHRQIALGDHAPGPLRRYPCGVPEVGPGSLTSADRWSDMIPACRCGCCT